MNLRLLADGSLLHTRFLQFGNSTIQGEVLGSMCRTWGAGTHPFASGFKQIELTDVEWMEEQAGFRVSGAGVSVQNVQGTLEQTEGQWCLKVGPR